MAIDVNSRCFLPTWHLIVDKLQVKRTTINLAYTEKFSWKVFK